MTANHLLLYRFAELMLAEQQHQLPVDLLFEDEQIGEFVKSIQIDSPYQQMLLEGVLTETVKEERLYVTFTVEGYFHYVLGEVIFNQAEDKGPEFLKDIIENNKLNGALEGVEQCLIRDVENDDLSRLMWLIDEGGGALDLCSVPLAQAFLQIKGKPKSDEELKKISKEQIKRVMDELLADPTDNDIRAIEKAIGHLNKVQKNHVVSIVYQQISISIQPKNLKNASLYLSSLRYVPEADLLNRLKFLENSQFENNNSSRYAYYLGQMGIVYLNKNIAEYKKAITLFNRALKINLKRYPKSYKSVFVNYNKLGLTYMLKREFDKSFENHQKALSILVENKCDDISSTLECLGIVEIKRKNFDNALDYFDQALKIKEMNVGKYHSNVSSTLGAIALIYSNKGDSENTIKTLKRALIIEENLNNNNKQHIAVLNKKLGDEYYKINNYATAINHLLVFHKFLQSTNKGGTVERNVIDKILKCYNSIGLEKYKSSEYVESINIYNTALLLMNETKTNQSKVNHTIYFNLGNAYFKNGQLKNAQLHLNQSLKLRIENYEKNSTLVGRAYNSLGNVELSKGNPEEAHFFYLKAHDIFLKILGQDHPHTELLAKKLKDLNDR